MLSKCYFLDNPIREVRTHEPNSEYVCFDFSHLLHVILVVTMIYCGFAAEIDLW